MAIRTMKIGGLALLLLLGGVSLLMAQEAVTEPAAQEAAAEAVMSCGDCHDLAKPFATNPHARGAVTEGVVDNSVCESCHEGASEHVAAGGDPEKVKIPTGRAGADNTCVTCHDSTTDRRSHRGGVHANSAAVNCFSCHSVHNADAKEEHLLSKSEPALCAGCHSTQVASLRSKPFAHKMGRGGMKCTSCHDAHGRSGRDNLRLTKAGEIACAQCHAEKRGPFVFAHGALSAGDCMSCHEPHGSSNARQLKRANVSQVCLECHSPINMASLGSQPPSFHNVSNPRYQNCTTCHVTIHGSNRSAQLLK